MKKITKKEIVLSAFMAKFINDIVAEFELSEEKKFKLTKMAVEDLALLFDSAKNNQIMNDTKF